MQTQTKLPTRTAESILQEIESGSFKNWSIATKALNVDSLESSKQICIKKLSDADTDRIVRLELSSYHQRIEKALLLVKNQPAIVPYNYVEVRYAKPEAQEPELLVTDDTRPNYEFIAYAVLSVAALLVIYITRT